MDNFKEEYKILIVEDSEADFELYKYFLRKDNVYKYQIFHAETGKETLDFFLAHSPDLILIDFSLPDANGLKLIETIQKIDTIPLTPIIMLTGQGSEAIALQAMKKQIIDYWIKSDLNKNKFLTGIHQVIPIINEGKKSKKQKNSLLKSQVINVLIVDDSEVVLELYSQFLSQDKENLFNIYTKTNGKECLEFCQEKEVDIILIDYQLPDLNGLILIEKIRQIITKKHFPMIIMTGQGNEQLVIDSIKKGASDYLVKQFITPETLRKTIIENLDQSTLLNHVEKHNFQRNLLSKIIINIRHSLDLEQIINTSCLEIRKYLQCDRVILFQLNKNGLGKVVGESLNDSYSSLLGLQFTDTFFTEEKNISQYINSCRKQVIDDITKVNMENCHRQLLEGFEVKSIVTLPILVDNLPNSLWGLFIIHFCENIHYWTELEVNFLEEISQQISIGIQQGLLIEELKKERDKANQATIAKSAFLANMSHEIRTPMTGILGLTELALLNDLDETTKDYLNLIQSSGQNLLNLINDILDLSKLESGKLELRKQEFTLSNILQEIINFFTITIQNKHLKLSLELEENLPKTYQGDSQRLKQILINLIGNAIKFTEKGEVKIVVKKERNPEYLNNKNKLQDNEIMLYFAVKDTGIGIALEDQKKLFQPFSQVEDLATRKYGGSGLGLSICKNLVHLMGGNIGIKSNINQGSIFWFNIILESQKVPLQSLVNQESQKQQLQDFRSLGTILVAEDSTVNQKVIKAQLKKINYDCDIANNGEEVIEKLGENDYKLIFMDCQMPIRDGYDTTKIIRNNPEKKDIIIIGLTAFAMNEDRQKCIDVGMNDYLSKPCSIAQLQEMINKWV